MARHYYSIEVVTDTALEEEELEELEQTVNSYPGVIRALIEYADSEG